MRVAYTGHEALTFGDYLDLETGKTLHAVPGGVYDIAPASGHVVPGFPVPWFTFADEEEQGEPEPEAEPGPEPEPAEPDPSEG